MTAPILTLAEVQALGDLSVMPKIPIEADGYEMSEAGDIAVWLSNHGPPSAGFYAWHKRIAGFVRALPAIHATCKHLFGEVATKDAEIETLIAYVKTLEARGKQDTDALRVASVQRADLHAEVARLTAELAEERKPLADAWRQDRDARGPFWWRPGCMTSKVRGEGRRERDLELVAAGWSLVGGVFGEVSDAKT